MAFKPKQGQTKDDYLEYEDEEEIVDEDVDEEETPKKKVDNKEVKSEIKEKESQQLTIQEIVDIIEGHLLRANQLLQVLK